MAPAEPGRQVILCGEVRTSVLRTSAALTARTATQLLNLRPDEHVLLSERPNLRVVSPQLLTGVDCRLPALTGLRAVRLGPDVSLYAVPGPVTRRSPATARTVLVLTADLLAVLALLGLALAVLRERFRAPLRLDETRSGEDPALL